MNCTSALACAVDQRCLGGYILNLDPITSTLLSFTTVRAMSAGEPGPRHLRDWGAHRTAHYCTSRSMIRTLPARIVATLSSWGLVSSLR